MLLYKQPASGWLPELHAHVQGAADAGQVGVLA